MLLNPDPHSQYGSVSRRAKSMRIRIRIHHYTLSTCPPEGGRSEGVQLLPVSTCHPTATCLYLSDMTEKGSLASRPSSSKRAKWEGPTAICFTSSRIPDSALVPVTKQRQLTNIGFELDPNRKGKKWGRLEASHAAWKYFKYRIAVGYRYQYLKNLNFSQLSGTRTGTYSIPPGPEWCNLKKYAVLQNHIYSNRDRDRGFFGEFGSRTVDTGQNPGFWLINIENFQLKKIFTFFKSKLAIYNLSVPVLLRPPWRTYKLQKESPTL